MLPLVPARAGHRLSVLCLGAHADDIEIGAGGTILGWIAAGVKLDIHWCVLSAAGPRREEARASAEDFVKDAARAEIELADFTDTQFPEESREIKAWLNDLRGRVQPDLILTHRGDDAHQDHREVNRLIWTVFRNHLILEYEVPKWDGDLGRPNLYVPLHPGVLERKIDLLISHFGSQRSKDWFDAETFRGLARLRGMECRAAGHYAEAFHVRKAILGMPSSA